jgi:hypothetical protein
VRNKKYKQNKQTTKNEILGVDYHRCPLVHCFNAGSIGV